MAYDASNLSALTYANGFTLWHYKTPDTATVVDGGGYFNEAASMLRVGDFVFANTGIGGTVAVRRVHRRLQLWRGGRRLEHHRLRRDQRRLASPPGSGPARAGPDPPSESSTAPHWI